MRLILFSFERRSDPNGALAMVVLRATQKLRRQLPLTPGDVGESDTALGDWYVNRLVVDRRPLLLLMSAKGLLPLLLPARDVRTLPQRLPALVAIGLRRLGIAPSLIADEVAAMDPIAIAPTNDRRVLGFMNDSAQSLPYHLDVGRWDETTLPFIEARLTTTLRSVRPSSSKYVTAVDMVPLLLAERWGVE